MPVANLFRHSPDRIFSMNALRRAWNHVRRSGTSTGTDGITLDQFESDLDTELNRLRQQVTGGTYTPLPVHRFFIKKSSGKLRPICIWTVKDRVLQRTVVDYLSPILERIFLDCSYGFRPGRSVQTAVEAIASLRDKNHRWVLDADIRDCFGSIDTNLLMGQVARTVPSKTVMELIEQWLHTPIEGESTEKAGVSQGGVISPLLANLYLHRFDEMMRASLPQSKLVRFADDFITLNESERETEWSLHVARRSLENLRLQMNMRKTRIVHFDEGFTFLGYDFQSDTHGKS